MTEQRSAQPVLVGVDGSPGSLAAVEFGAWEANRRRVPLHLINGYSDEAPYLTYGLATVGSLTRSPRERARATVHEIELQTQAAHPELAIHGMIMAGGGASSLVELSRDASLVVVGSRGHGGFADLLVGSVTAQVAMHAHAPVVIMRPPFDDPTQAVSAARLEPTAGPVVVGLDGSAGSEVALRFAVDEAVARHQPLVVAYVWWAPPDEALRPDRAADPSAALNAANQVIADAVEPLAATYPELSIERRAIHHLNPTWALVEVSREASLLVVGTRGRGGFASLLLGSVSRGVAAHAQCPIAVVRHHP